MKTRMAMILTLCAMLAASAGYAQNLQGIVQAGDKLQKIAVEGAFTSVDALCWDNGMLFFANNDSAAAEKSVTCRLNPDGTMTAIHAGNGITTAIKPSGKGTYYCAEYAGRRIVEMDRDGRIIRTVADNFKGTPFVGPNDLVVDGQGGIYFSDARESSFDEYAENTSSVYYIKPDGTVLRADKSVFHPSGLALSPDGKLLYVANAYGDNVLDFAYVANVKPDGTLSDMRKFCTLYLSIANESIKTTYEGIRCPCSTMTNGVTHYIATSGADGCAVDASGNVYVATNQGIGVQVFNPGGEYLGNINLTGFITNCCFGGADMMTLYVSAKDGLYSIQTRIPGLRIADGGIR